MRTQAAVREIREVSLGASFASLVRRWKNPNAKNLSIRIQQMKNKFALLLCIVQMGCAIEVPRTPANFVMGGGQVIRLEADTPIDVGTGYPRFLPRGTVLKQVGTVADGDVFKPVNFTLTLEGANVHEAFLVLKNNELVGFYLPVEQAFVFPKTKITTKFSIKDRI